LIHIFGEVGYPDIYYGYPYNLLKESDSVDRLFIGIPLGAEQRSAIQRQKETLQHKFSFQKWVHPDDLHITLKFLGETDNSTTEKIIDLLKELAAAQSPFTLGLNELGIFGKPSAPSILWMGIQGELSVLSALQAQIEFKVEPLGFAREDRPYSPHITLARRYQGHDPFSKELLTAAAVDLKQFHDSWAVGGIILYRSRLNRQPMYEAIETFPLGAKETACQP
jgi:2'-5' RNA ligase